MYDFRIDKKIHVNFDNQRSLIVVRSQLGKVRRNLNSEILMTIFPSRVLSYRYHLNLLIIADCATNVESLAKK
jgi:hypothetical protein